MRPAVTVTITVRVDVADLYACLDRARDLAGLSWRQLAAQAGCSPSTFTRLSQGHTPDTTTFLTLVSWLRADVEDFVDGTVNTAARIARLEGQIVEAKAEAGRAHSERLAAQRQMETARRNSREAKQQAEGWRLAADSYVRQLNLARDQLVANGIEPDRRII